MKVPNVEVRMIVVGIDGSPSSQSALDWALRYARSNGSDVVAVTAYDVPWTVYLTPTSDSATYAERARELLEETVSAVAPNYPSVQIEMRVVQDHAVRALANAAVGADLIVVGSHGAGSMSDLLIGSVAQALASQAPCPVVIHRQPGSQ
jgi:nucleotide-binding universal stress UspA family protein